MESNMVPLNQICSPPRAYQTVCLTFVYQILFSTILPYRIYNSDTISLNVISFSKESEREIVCLSTIYPSLSLSSSHLSYLNLLKSNLPSKHRCSVLPLLLKTEQRYS